MEFCINEIKISSKFIKVTRRKVHCLQRILNVVALVAKMEASSIEFLDAAQARKESKNEA